MRVQKVKRCGFCGSQDVYFGAINRHWRVYCGTCGGAGGVRATKTVALATWNQRCELGASMEAFIEIGANPRLYAQQIVINP